MRSGWAEVRRAGGKAALHGVESGAGNTWPAEVRTDICSLSLSLHCAPQRQGASLWPGPAGHREGMEGRGLSSWPRSRRRGSRLSGGSGLRSWDSRTDSILGLEGSTSHFHLLEASPEVKAAWSFSGRAAGFLFCSSSLGPTQHVPHGSGLSGQKPPGQEDASLLGPPWGFSDSGRPTAGPGLPLV